MTGLNRAMAWYGRNYLFLFSDSLTPPWVNNQHAPPTSSGSISIYSPAEGLWHVSL
jgi:hypothetical protein